MKKLLLVSLLVLTSLTFFGQSYKAEVQRVKGIPVFVYSQPIDDYEVVTTINVPMFATSQLKDKINAIITKVESKKKKGKISDFDAIIIDDINNSGTVIKFKD